MQLTVAAKMMICWASADWDFCMARCQSFYSNRHSTRKAQRVARPQQTRLQNSGGYWTKVHQICIRRRRVIGDLNTHIHVAIFSSVVECQRTEWRRDYPMFADSRQKSVTIATSLERSWEQSRIDYAHPYLYLSWKFSEARSSTFWDNWSPRGPLKRRWNKVTSVEHFHSRSVRHAGVDYLYPLLTSFLPDAALAIFH